MRVARKSHSAQEIMSRRTAEKSEGRKGGDVVSDGMPEVLGGRQGKVRVGVTATTGDLQVSGVVKAWEKAFFTRFHITVVVS